MRSSQRGASRMAGNLSADGARYERRLSSVEQELVLVKGGLNTLDIRVSETSKDITDFRQEWRDQKEAERRSREEHARARQLGIPQIIGIVVGSATLVSIGFAGFFFLVKAYVDGSVTPQITQLTERQNSTSQSALTRNEIIANIQGAMATTSSAMAELSRVVTDTRSRVEGHAPRLREVEENLARVEERLSSERDLRATSDTSIREELRSFKSQVSPSGN